MHKYSEEEKTFMREFIPGHKYIEIQSAFIKKFGWDIKVSQIKSYMANNKINSGTKGYFPKGHVPANKGTKGGGWEPTQFKKGSIPPNRLPIGSERIDSKDGYVYVKIQDGHLNKNWKQKHVLIWEQHNGLVPKGHNVIFGDRNNRNFEPNNLILVTKQQMLVLNRHKLIQNDAELTKTGLIIADLMTKISQRKR